VRISRIEAIPVAYPEPNDCNAQRHLCLVRMQADDGQVGWGESITQWPEASRATQAIIEGMAPLLIGKDPVHTDSLWRSLKEHAWWYGNSGIASFAIAALDIALWDLKGKALGVSVLDLLGGAVHERLPAIASAHAFRADMADMADEIAGWIGRGLHGAKIGFGKKGDAHLGYEHDRDIAFVEAVREAIGPTPDIMIDLGVKVYWDVSTAIRRVRAMEEFGLAWIEEPLGPADPAGYAVLRGASLAVSFASPACRLFEIKPLRNPMQHDLVASPIEPVEGWMHPPQGPGLGIHVLDDVVNHYRADV
jgi:L-alanine-DL-glutamate epimerase-like enolase superfamily enzyme